jgi:hypothetical protein
MAAAFNAAELGAEGFEGRQRQNATSAHSREAAALAPLLPVLNDLATVESIVVAGVPMATPDAYRARQQALQCESSAPVAAAPRPSCPPVHALGCSQGSRCCEGCRASSTL